MSSETPNPPPEESASQPSETAAIVDSTHPGTSTPAEASSEMPSPQADSEASPAHVDPPATPQNGAGAVEGTAQMDGASAGSPAEAQDASTGPSVETPDGDAPAESMSSGTAESQEGTAKKRKRRRRKKQKGDSTAPSKPPAERAPFHVGEEVFGRVTAVLPDAIMVDLSGKALGIFDRHEMEADDLIPSEGDRFLARVHHASNRGGLVVLTRKPLREEEARQKVEAAAKDGTLVLGLVTGVIKGGIDVDLDGLRAFAPASGIDLHPQNANFAALVGTRLEFKVSQYENAGRDVVVTRRPMLEAEAHERRKKALSLLEDGQVLEGVVRTIVDWGVFVALPEAENLEGLVHASEASHDPRAKLAELFKTGEKIEVQITKIDEKGKIWLSRKALVADPWKEAKDKYPSGARFTTKITRVEAFGAFCELDGIEGLIHIADLSPKRIEHANEVVKPGDELEVVVHQFDLRNHKVALHPALTGDQANEERQKTGRNANVRVEVVKADAPGLNVRIKGSTGRQARGFIPAGQTGTQRGTDLRKHFKPGDELNATILDIDPRRGEAKLSIRRFHENEERSAHREYRKQLAEEGGFGTLGDLLRKSLGQ